MGTTNVSWVCTTCGWVGSEPRWDAAPDEPTARAEAIACARRHAAEQVARWQETLRALGGAP